MRLLLIGVFTWMIDRTGAGMGYLVLAGLLLLAAVGIVGTMRHLLDEQSGQSAVATKER